mmetsp:Transcript_36625/g.77201  ORF Transcript_36625/g.77201 Transcript_36625/m.77201 type:complete len:80 (+) Transcript_36625:86-325(+)
MKKYTLLLEAASMVRIVKHTFRQRVSYRSNCTQLGCACQLDWKVIEQVVADIESLELWHPPDLRQAVELALAQVEVLDV